MHIGMPVPHHTPVNHTPKKVYEIKNKYKEEGGEGEEEE